MLRRYSHTISNPIICWQDLWKSLPHTGLKVRHLISSHTSSGINLWPLAMHPHMLLACLIVILQYLDTCRGNTAITSHYFWSLPVCSLCYSASLPPQNMSQGCCNGHTSLKWLSLATQTGQRGSRAEHALHFFRLSSLHRTKWVFSWSLVKDLFGTR